MNYKKKKAISKERTTYFCCVDAMVAFLAYEKIKFFDLKRKRKLPELTLEVTSDYPISFELSHDLKRIFIATQSKKILEYKMEEGKWIKNGSTSFQQKSPPQNFDFLVEYSKTGYRLVYSGGFCEREKK